MFYPYTACGLPNVYLLSGYTLTKEDGEECLTVTNVHELHNTLGHHLCSFKNPTPFTSEQIRFLRTELGLTSQAMASVLGVTDQQYLKWETTEAIHPSAEALLRLYYIEEMSDADGNHYDGSIRNFLDTLAHYRRTAVKRESSPPGFIFLFSNNKWFSSNFSSIPLND